MHQQPRRSRLYSLSLLAGGAAFFCVAAISAWAQVAADRPVLHRDLPPPGETLSGTGDPANSQSLFGSEPSAGQNPSAFAYRSKILPAPNSPLEPAENEPIHGQHGVSVDRTTEQAPDRNTRTDPTLQYVSIFNPSVLPFKRMSALDSVRADYTLYVADEDTREDLTVGGAPSPSRDLFWGDIVVEFSPGRDIPIPSVSPDMRIISYEVEPRIAVTFSKDGSDNYFVRSDENDADGTYRLLFMADAASTYFAPEVPSLLRVRDVSERAPPGMIKAIPEELRDSVQRSLSRLSVDRDMPLRRAINRLVLHFREFEAGYLAQDTGDLYLDLVQQQLGVCRHRAFAFMVTANGLGLPTRYVTNEAHAWVEMWVPETGWMRIDLGGAALRMVVDNSENKSLYQPRGEDPFTKPPSYQNNYTQLEGEISGLSDEQITEGRLTASTASDESFRPGPGPSEVESDPRSLMIAPGESLPSIPAAMSDGKQPTRLRLTYVDQQGFRGETMTVSGRLLSQGKGVGGQRIDVYLAPAGNSGDDALFADRTVTETDGGFTVYVQLPASLELRDYEVYASTPGDGRFAPALSD